MTTKDHIGGMAPDGPVATIREHIHWAVQIDAVLVIDVQTNGHCRLQYPQAALWDMLSRNYAENKMVARIRPIAGLNEAQARNLVKETLSHWEASGLIDKGSCHG